MARRIIITLPDDDYWALDASYVHEVAEQLAQGYVGGSLDTDRHWTQERD